MTIEYQPPLPPERAVGYLIKEGYSDLRKILAVARTVSGYIYAGLSEKKLEQLLQTIYDEDYHAAYKGITAAYRGMDNAVPRYIQALYSWFPIWKVFLLFVYEATSNFRMEQDKCQVYPHLSELIRQAFPADLL